MADLDTFVIEEFRAKVLKEGIKCNDGSIRLHPMETVCYD